MRERVEDLGRIAILLDKVLELDVFSIYQGREKDFVEHFYSLSKDDQDDMLHKLIYGLSGIEEDIGKIYEIAMGWDIANQPNS